MSVRTNIGNGVVNVATTDTILFTPVAIDRYQVGSCNVHNTTVADIVVSVYVSPDTTSAAGDLVFTGTVGAGSEIDINSIVGQGYIAQNIIIVGAAIGLNAQLTRTEYTAGD